MATIDYFYRKSIYAKTDSVALDLTAFSFITVMFSVFNSSDYDHLHSNVLKLVAILVIYFLGLILHKSLLDRTKEEIETYFDGTLRKKIKPDQEDLLIQLKRLAVASLEVDVGYHAFGLRLLSGNSAKEKKRIIILESLKTMGLEEDDFEISTEDLLINHRGMYLFFYVLIGVASLVVVAV